MDTNAFVAVVSAAAVLIGALVGASKELRAWLRPNDRNDREA